MPDIIMSHRPATALFHRKARLSPVERLNLRFFVHAQNQRSIRRIEIQAYDIRELFDKLFVPRELEIANAVRLQTVAVPNPSHGHVTDPKLFCHRPTTPVSRIVRLGVKGRLDNRLDLIFIGAA